MDHYQITFDACTPNTLESNDTAKQIIEALIDAQGMVELLHVIADVCGEKDEHLRANWQEQGLALDWHKTMLKVHALAASREVRTL